MTELGEASTWDWLFLALALRQSGVSEVQVEQVPRLSATASEVVGIEHIAEGAKRIRQNEFGLLDSGGPLPEAFVEAAFHEVRVRGDGPWSGLINLLTDRFAQSDFNAWRPRLEAGGASGSFVRFGEMFAAIPDMEIWRRELLACGHAAHGCIGAELLVDLVRYVLPGTEVELEQYVPQWLPMPLDGFVSIGDRGEARLGNWVIGSLIPSADSCARLVIRVADWAMLRAFLLTPENSTLARLLFHVGAGALDWTIQMSSLTPPKRNRGNDVLMALGVDSWIADDVADTGDFRCVVHLWGAHRIGLTS